MRCLSTLTLMAASCLLVSCIDGYEEYWLEADGSGRAQIHYDVPAIITRNVGGADGISKMLDRFIQRTPSLTNTTRQVTLNSDRMTVDFNTSFKSMLGLIDAVRGDPALSAGDFKSVVSPLIGTLDIRQSGLRVDMTRVVCLSDALPGAGFMPASQFEGRRMVYILHLPRAARESNATRTRDGGRTLIWDRALQDCLKKSTAIELSADMPLPRWVLPSAAVVLALLLGWGLRWIRRRTSRSNT